MSSVFDVTVVGAGILGLAAAMKLVKTRPGLKVAVIEKEDRIAAHQTGHNSGVIHSGIYYRPGSFKAKMCVSGAEELVRFCREEDVPFELCGKVVIAVKPDELPRLHELHRRGADNGVPGMKLLDPAEARSLEPHATCLQGLHVPTTGITDFSLVAQAYSRVFQAAGGRLILGARLHAVRFDGADIRLDTAGGTITTRALINCAGLYSDRTARMAGVAPPCRIVPFRGEYYRIRPDRSFLVKNLIYPVPDPRFPFLGVHFTRMLGGKVEAGPNAVLAFAREGYTKGTVNPIELAETLTYPGFRRLALKYWRPGFHELARSFSKERFARALQGLVPEIRKEDLAPGGAGVRAQALGKDGALLDDFVIIQKERTVHVLNAPSPAATSSLAIAEHILSVASEAIGQW